MYSKHSCHRNSQRSALQHISGPTLISQRCRKASNLTKIHLSVFSQNQAITNLTRLEEFQNRTYNSHSCPSRVFDSSIASEISPPPIDYARDSFSNFIPPVSHRIVRRRLISQPLIAHSTHQVTTLFSARSVFLTILVAFTVFVRTSNCYIIYQRTLAAAKRWCNSIRTAG